MLISLRNRLVLVFFAITVLAFAALYLYVTPGLRTRLVDARLHDSGRRCPHLLEAGGRHRRQLGPRRRDHATGR